MTLRQRTLPSVPQGVSITKLGVNLKLYSEAEIREIKRRFVENGRYRQYVDNAGVTQTLAYPIFVCEGQYFASYPGRLHLESNSVKEKVKLAQNLTSGEWVDEKIFKSITEDELVLEAAVHGMHLNANSAEGKVLKIYREKKEPAAIANSAAQENKFFGGDLEGAANQFMMPEPQKTRGKGYIFLDRAREHALRDVQNTHVNVGMLDISEFYAASERGVAHLQQYIRGLGVFDFVFLVCTDDDLTDHHLLAIKQKLQAHNILVSQQVMTVSHAEMYEFLAENNIITEQGRRFQFKFLTSVPDEAACARHAVDVRFQFGVDDYMHRDSHDFNVTESHHTVESYDLLECLGWFFKSLVEDTCRPVTVRLRSRFDIFSRSPSPYLTDSDSEEPDPSWERLRKMV